MYVGKDIADNSIALAFLPEDITNNIVVYFRKAVPISAKEILFAAREKTILSCMFYCIRDDTITDANSRYKSRGFFIGDRRDLVI